LDNLALIAERNKILNTGTHVYWQFLVFKHNEHEIETAKTIANNIGILIQFLSPSIPDDHKDEWESSLYTRTNTEKEPDIVCTNGDTMEVLGEKSICPWPWRGLTVQSTGDVSLCCLHFSHDYDIGTVDNSVCELWNSEYNLAARAFVNGHRILDTKIPCKHCVMRNSPSCHPPRHIGVSNVINSGIIPERYIRMYDELRGLVMDGGNYYKLFQEISMIINS